MAHLQPALVTRRIVAIGGGGFLLDDARLLQESYLTSLCRKPCTTGFVFRHGIGGC